MTVKSPRLAAFEALYKIQQESAYSNLSLDHLPVANGQERAFATALVRGVLERQITLDALVDKFTTGRLKPKVRVLLRMGAYQALYMDKVPVPAAVNETVELAKTVGQGYYGRMINAVLRQIAADPDLPDTPMLRYSVPQPLLAMWQKTYGADVTAAFLPYINGRAPLFLVPNPLFVTPGQLQEMLANEGVQARLLPEKVLTVDDGFDVERSAAFQKGYFHVQDLSCYLACAALQVRPGQTVLDVCAAPGGKSFTLAEQMNMSRSNFYRKIKGVLDLSPNEYLRLIRLKKAAQLLKDGRYGIVEISYMVGFNSPSYFSNCFKKQFGVLPKDFMQ